MAHKQLEDGRVVVDWTTGDPEGDRIHLLKAYSDFINEILTLNKSDVSSDFKAYALNERIEKWKVSTDNQVDEVPRIWIERP